MSRTGTLPVMATAGRGAARPGSSGRQANRLQSCITLRPPGLSYGWRWLPNGPSLITPPRQPMPKGSASFWVRGHLGALRARGPELGPNNKTLIPPVLSHLVSVV